MFRIPELSDASKPNHLTKSYSCGIPIRQQEDAYGTVLQRAMVWSHFVRKNRRHLIAPRVGHGLISVWVPSTEHIVFGGFKRMKGRF